MADRAARRGRGRGLRRAHRMAGRRSARPARRRPGSRTTSGWRTSAAAARSLAWAEHETWLADTAPPRRARRLEAERTAAGGRGVGRTRPGSPPNGPASRPRPGSTTRPGWPTERAAVEEEAWAAHEAGWTAKRAEAKRLEAERKAVEAKAWKEHKAWLAAERTRVEETPGDHEAWLAAERAPRRGRRVGRPRVVARRTSVAPSRPRPGPHTPRWLEPAPRPWRTRRTRSTRSTCSGTGR